MTGDPLARRDFLKQTMTAVCAAGVPWLPARAAYDPGAKLEISVREVEFHALNPMHGKEDHTERERFAVFDERDEVLERSQINSTQAEAFGAESKNRSPEFFAGIGQGGNHHGAGSEGAAACA